MSKHVLRRKSIPRLQARLPRKTALPGFLIPHRALPMTPFAIAGPHDRLEQAIMDGVAWDETAEPVQISAFDAQRDLISIVLEDSEGEVEFSLKHERDHVRVYANGTHMVDVVTQTNAFSLSNIRVLQPRPSE